jgi:DNA-binding transcriptional regulator YiaG
MRTHVTRVGRWTVRDSGLAADLTMKDGTPILNTEQMTALELRAAIAVFRGVELVEGPELKFARKAMGLRQTDLANHLGVNAETVSRWETNTDTFKRPVQLALLQMLEEFQRTGGIARPVKSARGADRILVLKRAVGR